MATTVTHQPDGSVELTVDVQVVIVPKDKAWHYVNGHLKLDDGNMPSPFSYPVSQLVESDELVDAIYHILTNVSARSDDVWKVIDVYEIG